MQTHRPLGVTIIAILMIIIGILSLALGALLLVILIGIAFIILAIAYFVMAYGLWKGKTWAWAISLILAGIGIILGIASLVSKNGSGAIIQIIINGIIIYYLYRPNVKAFFGKTSTPSLSGTT